MHNSIWRTRLRRRDFLLGSAGFAAASTLGAGALSACGGEEEEAAAPAVEATIKPVPDGDLSYFNWADFIDPELVKGFEQEYGVKVNESYFDSDDAMIQKVASGLPYDFVCTNSAYLPRMIEAGLLQPLPHDEITNIGQVKEFYMDPWFDPGAQYSLPYGGGPTGIAWRTDKVDSATVTGAWEDLWQTPDADGHKYVLDQIEEALGMSLQRLGYEVDTEDATQLDEAAQALIELKPRLAGFSTDDINLLANGEAWIMQAWAGDVYWAAQSAGDPSLLAFKMPVEGGLIGWDMMSIPVKAEHPGTALLFIDWLLDPEHSAQNVQWHGYQSGTEAGDAAWAEVMQGFPQLEIPENPWEVAAWKLSPTGERQRLMNAAWTKVKAS